MQALVAEVATGGYPGREEIDVALGRLMERRGRREARASGIGLPPAKGDLCKMNVDQIDLPEAGSTPIMLDQVSETAAKLLSDFERHMLDPAGEEALESEGAGVYQDSALEDSPSLMLLAARL